jgi:hypothetical protein
VRGSDINIKKKKRKKIKKKWFSPHFITPKKRDRLLLLKNLTTSTERETKWMELLIILEKKEKLKSTC